MPKLAPHEQSVVTHLVELILDDNALQEHCHKVAIVYSDTINWDQQDWEDNEDSKQYRDYWSRFTYEARRIAACAVRKIEPNTLDAKNVKLPSF